MATSVMSRESVLGPASALAEESWMNQPVSTGVSYFIVVGGAFTIYTDLVVSTCLWP